MPIQVFINNGGGLGEIELTRYVAPGSIQITKSLNLPSTCSLTLVGSDQGFVLPVPRSYIRIYSTQYRRTLFTGLLTVDPARAFQGVGRSVPGTNFQMYQYNLSYTSDEYLLNIKSVDFIPAFVNQTQGQILKNLAEILAPGYYDTEFIASGDLVPYLQYDPTQTWSDYAKKFCDSSRYRYSAQDRQLRFQPYGDGNLGITYDEAAGEATFDPAGMSTSAMTTQVINDITVVGQQEAGDNHEDYFIGDGFTGGFPLKHQVYGLASSFQGSSVLLSDNWNNSGTLNTQNWFAQDPGGQFNYTGGNLNIISGFNLPYGLSFIYANNALELAGGVVIQHGEIQINDASTGLIGGIYDDQTMNPNSCEAAFQLTPTQSVVVTASGASGIAIQPFRNGAVPATAFSVISKINKSYTLYTKITAQVPTRYLQVFRSIAGYQFGGYSTVSSVSGAITWTVLETDNFSGFQTYYYFTLNGLKIPDTAIYGLINNRQLNISLGSTQVWTPPPGSLNIQTEIGSGLLAPIYISGNVQYTGAFVTPSGGHLPIQLGSNDPVSAAGFGPEQQFDMGSGIGNQAAEIDSGTLTSTLNFYSNDLPGVGTRIRLQSYESQAAVSRVRDTASVALESAIVGDDGVRASTMSDLNPLPRTSEDCDNAAQAILKDRTGIFYQGTYNCTYKFFSNNTGDMEFYPTCGRYLFVNAPMRNMYKQKLIVTSLTITVTEQMGEILNFSISFGPDMYLEKLLAQLTPSPQSNVLQATDTAIQPTPQQLSRIGDYFLPDVAQTTLAGQVSGTQITLSLRDALPSNAIYEVRTADIGTWGRADSTLLYRFSANQDITIPRSQYDQSWFLKMVSGSYVPIGGDNTTFNANAIALSRRTKVIRVTYPQIPTAPALLTKDTAFVQMDFAGDIRNIEGLEIRYQDDATVCYQCIVGSRFDMGINMDQLRNQLSPGEPGLVGLGQFLVNPFPVSGRDLKAHFFNLMMEYSPALDVTMSPFSGPSLREGYRFGSAIALGITPFSGDLNRTDFAGTNILVANDAGLTSIQQKLSVGGAPNIVTFTAPASGDLYIAAQYVDHVGSGAWSPTLHIPVGNLIASDWLGQQGSIPPSVLVGAGSGALINYAVGFMFGSRSIALTCQQFAMQMPNGNVITVPAGATFEYNISADAGPNGDGSIWPLTNYGFFCGVLMPPMSGNSSQGRFYSDSNPFADYTNPASSDIWVGHPPPYLTVSGAIAGIASDGSIPILNGALVVQTPSSGSWSGGGSAGGSFTNLNCGIETSEIELATKSSIMLKDLKIGDIVRTPNGVGKVSRIEKSTERVASFVTESGLMGTASLSHVLRRGRRWVSIQDIIDMGEDGEAVTVATRNSENDKLISVRIHNDEMLVIKIHLVNVKDASEDVEHYYMLDGFWAHNLKMPVVPSAG